MTTLSTLKEIDRALDLLIPFETVHTARQSRAHIEPKAQILRSKASPTRRAPHADTEQQSCSDTQQLKELLLLLHTNEARLSPYLDTEAVRRNLRRALAV